MLARHRTALLSFLLALGAALPVAAGEIALPREAQLGPRPFYLVDKMKDGAPEAAAQPMHRAVPQDRFFDWPSRRRAAISRA
ncbi:hypothetical protein ACVIHH_002767 [Bradyrhizobium sp. USDA 4518]